MEVELKKEGERFEKSCPFWKLNIKIVEVDLYIMERGIYCLKIELLKLADNNSFHNPFAFL